MSYRAGVGPALARGLGLSPGEPRVQCDAEGCASVMPATKRSGEPYAWLLNFKAPPRWRTKVIIVDGVRTRRDFCPNHKAVA